MGLTVQKNGDPIRFSSMKVQAPEVGIGKFIPVVPHVQHDFEGSLSHSLGVIGAWSRAASRGSGRVLKEVMSKSLPGQMVLGTAPWDIVRDSGSSPPALFSNSDMTSTDLPSLCEFSLFTSMKWRGGKKYLSILTRLRYLMLICFLFLVSFFFFSKCYVRHRRVPNSGLSESIKSVKLIRSESKLPKGSGETQESLKQKALNMTEQVSGW